MNTQISSSQNVADMYVCVCICNVSSDAHADGLVHDINNIRGIRERPKRHVHIHILFAKRHSA